MPRVVPAFPVSPQGRTLLAMSAPRPSKAGRVTALLPPTTRVSLCFPALFATASRITGVASSIVIPVIAQSPWSAILEEISRLVSTS